MEEISLKDLIRILFRYRFLILVIVGISVLLSIGYAFVIAVPMYDAHANIEVLGVETGIGAFDNANAPQTLSAKFIAQVRTPQFMEQVSRLLESNNIQIDKTALNAVISASLGADGKSIIISAEYKEKKDVAQIANAAADVLKEYSAQYLKEQIQQQVISTEKRTELAKTNSDEQLSKFKEYVMSPESLSKLRSQISVNQDVLVQLKANLISENIGSKKSKTQLGQDIMKIEEETRALNEKLDSVYSEDKIFREELESSVERYLVFKKDYNRLKFAEMYYQDNPICNILVRAVEPVSASKPDKKGIIIISLIASMCVGIFAAFTIEYFKNDR